MLDPTWVTAIGTGGGVVVSLGSLMFAMNEGARRRRNWMRDKLTSIEQRQALHHAECTEQFNRLDRRLTFIEERSKRVRRTDNDY